MKGRTARIVLGTVAATLLLGLLVLALFPWGALRGIVTREATERFGRPVTIGAVERVDTIGFHPVIAIRHLRISQAAWAGSGDFARVDTAKVRFSAWALLTGDFRIETVEARGLRLALVRDRNGRTNWSRPGRRESGGGATDLQDLTLTDSIITYRDAKQDRTATVRFAADPDTGLRAEGRGSIRGADVAIRVTGAPVRPGPWPFTAIIDGPALAMRAVGRMDRALDTNAMTLDLTARASDLKLIDAVVEAGLFRTRPVQLSAHVRHQRPVWTITDLKGTIGRSDLTGRITVDKSTDRTKLDGEITSRQFDFDDLSSAEGRAEAAALERRIGPRLVPNTRIDISKIDSTDGTIRFKVGRIVSAQGPSPITAMAGRLVLDHQLLRIPELRLNLTEGVVRGSAQVDQRGGATRPTLTLDLRLSDASVVSLAGGGGDFTGRVSARAQLTGAGETIRDAIGRSRGFIGLVVRNGTLPDRYAAALGFDAGRMLVAGDDSTAGLRCLVLRLNMRDGTGRVDPLVLDTTRSKLEGTGTVRFPEERIALRLTGAPKGDAILRLDGAALMNGTIRQPDLVIPREVKSIGNIFRSIGRAITGHGGPTANDANCGALANRALR